MTDSNQSDAPTIHLDQFLKICGVETGGQAKLMIQAGEVLLNGEVETRRRKQLVAGDTVIVDGEEFVVELAPDDPDEQPDDPDEQPEDSDGAQ